MRPAPTTAPTTPSCVAFLNTLLFEDDAVSRLFRVECHSNAESLRIARLDIADNASTDTDTDTDTERGGAD